MWLWTNFLSDNNKDVGQFLEIFKEILDLIELLYFNENRAITSKIKNCRYLHQL